MARLGRSQPHLPIYLRSAAAVVLLTTPMVVSQAVPRARLQQNTTVTYVRPSVITATVQTPTKQITVILAKRHRPSVGLRPQQSFPDKIPAQGLVVGQAIRRMQNNQRLRPPTAVLYLRALETLDVDKAQPLHIIQTRVPVVALPSGAVIQIRPSKTSLVPDRITKQITVVSQATKRVPLPGLKTDTLFIRNPQPEQAPQPTFHGQIRVYNQAVARLRYPTERSTAFLYIRPSRSSFVPDRLPPQLIIITQGVERSKPAKTRATLVRPFVAPAAPAPVVPRQITVVSPPKNVRQLGDAIFVRPSRASLVPERLAQKLFVTTQAVQASRRLHTLNKSVLLRGISLVAVPDRLPPQIHTVLSKRLPNQLLQRQLQKQNVAGSIIFLVGPPAPIVVPGIYTCVDDPTPSTYVCVDPDPMLIDFTYFDPQPDDARDAGDIPVVLPGVGMQYSVVAPSVFARYGSVGVEPDWNTGNEIIVPPCGGSISANFWAFSSFHISGSAASGVFADFQNVFPAGLVRPGSGVPCKIEFESFSGSPLSVTIQLKSGASIIATTTFQPDVVDYTRGELVFDPASVVNFEDLRLRVFTSSSFDPCSGVDPPNTKSVLFRLFTVAGNDGYFILSMPGPPA